MKQRSGSSSLSALKLKSFASYSEMVRGALYTSHEMSRVFTGSLRVVCERTHRFRKITGSVNEPKSNDPGMIHGTHYPCIFRNLCVKGASDSRKSSDKREKMHSKLLSSQFLSEIDSYKPPPQYLYFLSNKQ